MMNKVYITNASLRKISYLVDIGKITPKHYYELIVKTVLSDVNTNFVLNTKDRERIARVVETARFLDKVSDIAKIKLSEREYKSKMRVIYVSTMPAYHPDQECPKLHKDYENFSIPSEIEENDIEQYRQFFLKNIFTFKTDQNRFIDLVHKEFGVAISNIEEMTANNSGVTEPEQLDLIEEDALLGNIEEIKRFYEKEKEIIQKYCGVYTLKILEGILLNEKKPIDESVKICSVYNQWQDKKSFLAKEIINFLLIEQGLSDLHFDACILDALGLSSCKICSK